MAITAPERDIQGIIPLNEKEAAIQRWTVMALSILPILGVIGSAIVFWQNGFSSVDLLLFLGFYAFTGFGVTVGYHRLLTHRSFEAPRWLRGVFAVAGSMSVEGGVLSWVADHRRHHAYTDKDGDPHSPHLEDGALRGLWHAHMGWLFAPERTSAERWAPDLAKDPMMRRIDRLFPFFVVLTFGLPGLLGGLITWSWQGALSGLLWGGFARVFLLNHVTFSINSVCHFFGRRPYDTGDESRNYWPLAVISFGESWHNNHHAFPTSAFHGLGKTQLDPGGVLVWSLEKAGLARNVKKPSEKQILRASAS